MADRHTASLNSCYISINESIESSLKGHGNKADFLGFLQKLVPHESLTLPFEPFRFWLRILGDIPIWKTTPHYHRYGEWPTLRISDTGSCQLPASLIREVANSPHHWYAESVTPGITDIESRLLNFLKENSRKVVDSPHQWYGESPTPLIVESESRRLRVSPIWRVDDSAYHWVGESTTPRIGDMGSHYSKKKLIWCRFSKLLTAKPCL